jgi:uncharacterized protein
MIDRPFWRQRLESAWREAPIAWLAGVRRAGKTTLARSLGEDRILYLDCDLPAVSELVADPVLFFRGVERPVVVFDEIHRLPDPSRLLKIGADHFPHLRLLATGSSTLAVTRKFSDTLTGRKRLVHLTPVLWEELEAFGAPLTRRLLRGGLPEPLLAATSPGGFFREWMDSFFARDIQRLYAFRDPDKFTAVFEYLLRQSGGLMEVTRAAGSLGISRPTVESHLAALQSTHAVTVVRPFHGGGTKELVKMPKVYAFDTGFVAFSRGWDALRPDDHGPLWEHLVLDCLLARGADWRVQYWRDRTGREVDFVVSRGRGGVDAIECKWDAKHFEPGALKTFRSYYPAGRNYLVCPLTVPRHTRRLGGLEVRVCAPDALARDLVAPPR